MDITEKAKNIRSQFGEDGIIEHIFSVIGTPTKWCVELGALNGTHDSNTWALMQKGWSGVLLEADQTYFEKLMQNYAGNANAHCVNAFISFEGADTLDNTLARTPIPKEFDLLSLDIDGNEYHVWDSLVEYRPRLAVIEFNPTIPNEVSFVQPRDMTVFQGSSLRALVELGKTKGYELVAANEANAFFVLKELYPKFGIADNSIDALHTNTSMQTKLFQLYDGTLMISGFNKLLFRNIPIDVEKLQVLQKHERVYTAKIDNRQWMRKLKYVVRKLPLYSLLQKIRKSL
jgi:hypothetical protein